MTALAIQDEYSADVSHCYGCGRLNERGLHIRSFWNGQEATATFTPSPHHSAIPGYVYGGLLASLVDCHATGTAAAKARQDRRGEARAGAPPRFVTASLLVDYLHPTPLGVPLGLRAWPTEIRGRKIVIDVELAAEGKVCVRGRVVTVEMPEHMVRDAERP
ncbi:MAG: thioesterase [Gammaproteobacteria bacterium RBG_16_66_13]|nr:MAG: thioesterase [Gammaproteobacteria bacterium RBG_16_66_13]